jgi:tetratricopeptide (TPR) repeat protein
LRDQEAKYTVRCMSRLPLSSWLLASVLLGASVGVPRAALAQEAPRASGQSKGVEAADHVRRGLKARAAGRSAEAESAFESALEAADPERTTRAQRAEILGELGLCELDQREYRDAAEHLAKSLEEYQSLPPAVLRRVKAGEQKALQHIGRVYFVVSPSDAAVLLDGRPLGRATHAYTIFVEPGRHTIRARLAGYGDGVSTFDVAAGAKHGGALTLSRATERMARADNEASPANAKKNATSPARTPRAPAATPSSAGEKLSVVGVVLTGGTAVAGATLLIWGESKRAEHEERIAALRREEGWLQDTCLAPEPSPVCAELRDAKEPPKRLIELGWATLAASGAIGAATVSAFVFAPKGASNNGVSIVPVVTGQRAGLSVIGAW